MLSSVFSILWYLAVTSGITVENLPKYLRNSVYRYGLHRKYLPSANVIAHVISGGGYKIALYTVPGIEKSRKESLLQKVIIIKIVIMYSVWPWRRLSL
jgi:hypothetical protein